MKGRLIASLEAAQVMFGRFLRSASYANTLVLQGEIKTAANAIDKYSKTKFIGASFNAVSLVHRR